MIVDTMKVATIYLVGWGFSSVGEIPCINIINSTLILQHKSQLGT